MMSDQDIWEILKILAALLHMGNIKYKGKVVDNLDATDIPDKSNVELVANILGVNLQSLISALTSKTIFAQGESVVRSLKHNDSLSTPDKTSRIRIAIQLLVLFQVSTLNTHQSKDVRDAFAKGIYGR